MDSTPEGLPAEDLAFWWAGADERVMPDVEAFEEVRCARAA
jgi:hypothetical protein